MMVGGLSVAILAAVGVGVVMARRYRGAPMHRRTATLPPLVIPSVAGKSGTPRPAPARPTVPFAPAGPRREPLARPAMAPHAKPHRNGDGESDERTMIFARPTDRPLEHLPGSLEVLNGKSSEPPIRFVRTAGEKQIVTFGRREGPLYRHVQLHAPTVSRSHACMEFEGGGWTLVNLSATNPVVVNGVPLAGVQSRTQLLEGDTVEMGEMVFVFHET